MFLLNDVVKEFNLVHLNRHVAAGVDCIDCRLVGAALVHPHFVGITVRCHALVGKKLRRGNIAFGREQEVDGLALLVDGRVQILPDALDLDISLIPCANCCRSGVVESKFVCNATVNLSARSSFSNFSEYLQRNQILGEWKVNLSAKFFRKANLSAICRPHRGHRNAEDRSKVRVVAEAQSCNGDARLLVEWTLVPRRNGRRCAI